MVYSACGHRTLPIWEVEAELADGTRLLLHERFRPEPLKDFGPASLVSGAVDIAGEHHETSDYFDLVYSAARHNEHVVHWVILEQPVSMDGLPTPIKVVELHAPVPSENLPPEAFYLDESLQVIAEVDVRSHARERLAVEPARRFQRGDVDANGSIAVSDAIALLRYLFASGASQTCRKSADADDSGRIDVTDPIWIILHLFAGLGSLPAPFGSCGFDTTEDELTCNEYAGCQP